MPWFRRLSAEDRSWIGLIVQAGIQAFVVWYREPDGSSPVTAEVFGAAPRALTGVVSLHQTVEMVRLTIEIVEENIVETVGERRRALGPRLDRALRPRGRLRHRGGVRPGRGDARRLGRPARGPGRGQRAARRGRRDGPVPGQRARLGVHGRRGGRARPGPGRRTAPARESIIDDVRRSARHVGLDALCAVQGDRMVVVLGGVDNPDKAGAAVAEHFGHGPVVVGPVVPDLMRASISARAATAGLRAAPGWPDAPRPVTSDDLLPERALSGDGHARRQLVQEVYLPLAGAGHPPWTRSRRSSTTAARSRAPPGRCSCTRTRCATGCAGPRR